MNHSASVPRFGHRAFAVLAISVAGLLPTSSQSFTQSGVGTAIANGIPMGHEWVTRLAALELIGGDPIMRPDPRDPRRTWRRGLAKNLSLDTPGAQAEVARIKRLPMPDSEGRQRYQPGFQHIYHAILGERWVDIGGFNVTKGHIDVDCFDAVAQEPAEVQYDHFMRRYDDRDGEGGVRAARASRERFIEYFVAAAIAPPTTMIAWDGGGYSVTEEVDRNYFLFGRAVHLFQDSFSTEHTVRIAGENYERLHQVKSYLCAAGSEQHTHDLAAVLNYSSGDVIWRPGTGLDSSWAAYRPSNMKDVALVATEASKDLWAAFIRTMGRAPQDRAAVARQEAQTLVNNWLDFDEAEMRRWHDPADHRDATYVLASGQGGPGRSVADCMRDLGEVSGDQMARVRKLEATQRLCLFNIRPVQGYNDLFDPSLKLHYHWEWTTSGLLWPSPPAGWTIPTQAADTGQRTRIRAMGNNQSLSAPDGLYSDSWIYARNSAPALDFIMVPGAYFRLANAPRLFLSYRELTGAVKLFNSAYQADFDMVTLAPDTYALRNRHWDMYMWLDGASPYISRPGNPGNTNARWVLEMR